MMIKILICLRNRQEIPVYLPGAGCQRQDHDSRLPPTSGATQEEGNCEWLFLHISSSMIIIFHQLLNLVLTFIINSICILVITFIIFNH
jgi:hypothetical protein